MLLFEITNAQPFDRSTTGVDRYDSWLRNPAIADNEGFDFHIETMSPKQYLQKCCDGFNCSFQQLMSTRQDKQKILKYSQSMKDGAKFPIPTLQYSYDNQFTQEGIHRSVAAIDAGVLEMPVMVIKEQ